MGAGRGRPLPQWGPGITSEILYAKPCFLGNICAIIGPQKWVHFAVLNTDVEAFLNQLFTRQLHSLTLKSYKHKVNFYLFIITENVHKLLVL